MSLLTRALLRIAHSSGISASVQRSYRYGGRLTSVALLGLPALRALLRDIAERSDDSNDEVSAVVPHLQAFLTRQAKGSMDCSEFVGIIEFLAFGHGGIYRWLSGVDRLDASTVEHMLLEMTSDGFALVSKTVKKRVWTISEARDYRTAVRMALPLDIAVYTDGEGIAAPSHVELVLRADGRSVLTYGLRSAHTGELGLRYMRKRNFVKLIHLTPPLLRA